MRKLVFASLMLAGTLGGVLAARSRHHAAASHQSFEPPSEESDKSLEPQRSRPEPLEVARPSNFAPPTPKLAITASSTSDEPQPQSMVPPEPRAIVADLVSRVASSGRNASSEKTRSVSSSLRTVSEQLDQIGLRAGDPDCYSGGCVVKLSSTQTETPINTRDLAGVLKQSWDGPLTIPPPVANGSSQEVTAIFVTNEI